MMRAMSNTDTQNDGAKSGYARLLGVGFTFLLILGIPTVIGYFVDGFLGTLPLFLLVGLALGFIGTLYYVYVSLQKLDGG